MVSRTPSVRSLRVERRSDQALADGPIPRLSWQTDAAPGRRQASVELRLDGTTTARLEGEASVFVDWPFAPLEPHARHTLEARVTDDVGETSPWSEPLPLRSAFLRDGEWRAAHIGLSRPRGVACPGLLRHEFELPAEVVQATLYAAGQGVYQASINGHDVDDAVLKPGWTAYQFRSTHETTDVTALLTAGRNAIGLRIAGGWWTEEFGYYGNAFRFYGDQPSVAAQLHLVLADGTSLTVLTGPHWMGAAAGPIVSSGIYAGERIDARLRLPGWDRVGFDDRDWDSARVAVTASAPEASLAEPVRRTQEVAVQRVLTSPSGGTILDFGQNLVGRLRVRLRGEAGTVITARHAEGLLYGELDTAQLRGAKATDEFVLSGGDDEFEPEFTFHGFRYAQLGGWPGELDPAAVTAVVIGSDMRRTGWFSSSSPLLDRFHENVVWGMRGNFLAIPTDCPQRDERLGWTGDIQVFSPTATSLYDCDGFLASWLRDVAAEQAVSSGVCPIVVPQVLFDGFRAAAVWGDAATVVPSVLFERFDDRRALAEQYPSMRAWADAVLALAGDGLVWRGTFQFGDWLDPNAPPEHPEASPTPTDLVATAYLRRSTRLVARAAAELGHDEDTARYSALSDRVAEAWAGEFTTGARTVCDTQTSYALAIVFELVDAPTRQAFGDRLAELVDENRARVATGFAGTPIVTDALTVTGHGDSAGRMMLQTEAPSWLYAVTQGATTVWERWMPLLPDGELDPELATSLNHYALGGVADWMHRRLAGLAPAEPGYRRLRIAPVPVDGLEHVEFRHETPYGLAAAGWERVDGAVRVHATVPTGTSAEVELPGREPFTVESGEHAWTIA